MPPTRRHILQALGAAILPAFVNQALAKIKDIEIGVCGPLKNFNDVASSGFDYFEPGAAEIAQLSDGDFQTLRRQVASARIPCKRANSFIRTLKVVGPEIDQPALTTYLNQTLDRCRQLGIEIIVWGSASSRNVPDGFPREEAWKQIRTFLTQAGDLARARNITIAIEPLRRQESNIFNTGAEALKMVKETAHPNVQMILDYYHVRSENESPDIVLEAAPHLVHLHFANPAGRLWPKPSDADPEYTHFFENLKKINYQSTLSIEGKGTVAADAADSLAFFRQHIL